MSGAGRPDDAIRYYQEMIKLEPDDAAARADIAEVHLSHRRYEQALEWAEETLRVAPDHTTAVPMSLFLKALLGRPGGDWEQALGNYCRANPGAERAANWLRCLQPYVGYLPGTHEASINGIRQFLDSREPGAAAIPVGSVTMTISSTEAPSCWLACEMALGWPRGTFTPTIEAIPKPDPRTPRGEVGHLLWTFDGTVPSPGLPPPHPMVVEILDGIVRTEFDAAAWWRAAGGVAAKLGPKAVPALLAAMVHPPTPPEGWPAWTWVQRVQHAAAFVAARVDAGWAGSARRGALLSMLRGPVDWTTNAGIAALTQLAVEEPTDEIVGEATAMVVELAEARPHPGYCCYEHAMVCQALRLPRLDARMRQELLGWKMNLERGDG
ncbi:MAG TPA: tetratricopeptide repeat protein, partial [Humisphaera sp.]